MGNQGKKKCDKCGTLNSGARRKKCVECGEKFYFKPKFLRRVTGKAVEWRTLRPGDVIKVLQSTGPVHIDTETGEEITMGVKGIVKVRGVHEDGITVSGEFGGAFVYMGPEGPSTSTTLYRRPHKIQLIKKKHEPK